MADGEKDTHIGSQWSLVSLLLKPITYATTSGIITPPPQCLCYTLGASQSFSIQAGFPLSYGTCFPTMLTVGVVKRLALGEIHVDVMSVTSEEQRDSVLLFISTLSYDNSVT